MGRLTKLLKAFSRTTTWGLNKRFKIQQPGTEQEKDNKKSHNQNADQRKFIDD
jgi:hypothetical protein